MTAVEKLQSVSNYFRGSDPKHWQTKVSNYSRLIYEDIYPGVNLICHGQQNEPEFDWIVQPGADTEHILLLVRGANPTINLVGDLVLKFTDSEVRLKKPVIYQEVGTLSAWLMVNMLYRTLMRFPSGLTISIEHARW